MRPFFSHIRTAGNVQWSCSTVDLHYTCVVCAVWRLLTVARNSRQILLQAALLQCVCSGRIRPFMRPMTSSGGSRPLQLTIRSACSVELSWSLYLCTHVVWAEVFYFTTESFCCHLMSKVARPIGNLYSSDSEGRIGVIFVNLVQNLEGDRPLKFGGGDILTRWSSVELIL